MMNTALSIVLGGIITLLTAASVEYLRKPRLVLSIDEPQDIDYEQFPPKRPARLARYLRVRVMNKPLPWFASWTLRGAAVRCSGTVTFHRVDGQDIFGRAMQVRWAGTPEPVSQAVVLPVGEGAQVVVHIPPQNIVTTVDIPPGQTEIADVAVRFDEEVECYGWNNESYFSQPVWHNSAWKLERGIYLVQVTVSTYAEKFTALFRLDNDGPRERFRLMPPGPQDSVWS